MRQLAILAGAAALIIVGWLLLTILGAAAGGYAALEIPEKEAAKDRIALMRSTTQLWNARPSVYRPDDVLRLAKMVAEGLGDADWRAVSGAVYFGWHHQRHLPEAQGSLAQVNGLLLPRFTDSLNLGELELLVVIACEKKFDAPVVDTALAAAAAAPMPLEGFEGSRAALIVTAALRAREYPRVRTYLEKLSWPASMSVEARVASLRPVTRILELCEQAQTGKPDADAAVAEWIALGARPWGRLALRPLLLDVAGSGIDALENAGRGAEAGPLLTRTATTDETRAFWKQIVIGRIGKVPGSGVQQTASFGGLAKAYEKRFGEAGFECDAWLEVADEFTKRELKDPVGLALILEKAFESAPSDWIRFQTVSRMAAEYDRVGEFGRSAKAVADAYRAISDPELTSAVLAMVENAARNIREDAERVAKQRLLIEQDRVRGQLQHLKDRLTVARQYGRGAEEVRVLESAIKNLEKSVPE